MLATAGRFGMSPLQRCRYVRQPQPACAQQHGEVIHEVGSLAQSAEALRLTAAAPARNTNNNADYEG